MINKLICFIKGHDVSMEDAGFWDDMINLPKTHCIKCGKKFEYVNVNISRLKKHHLWIRNTDAYTH